MTTCRFSFTRCCSLSLSQKFVVITDQLCEIRLAREFFSSYDLSSCDEDDDDDDDDVYDDLLNMFFVKANCQTIQGLEYY